MHFGLSKGEGYIEGVLGQVAEENIGFLAWEKVKNAEESRIIRNSEMCRFRFNKY
jgi:hypothetical protein